MQVFFSSINEVNNKQITLSQGGELWQHPVVYRNHFCMLIREDFSPTYPPCQAVTQARIVLPYRCPSPRCRSLLSTYQHLSWLSGPHQSHWGTGTARRQFVSPRCLPRSDNGAHSPHWQEKGLRVTSSSLRAHHPFKTNNHFNTNTTVTLTKLSEITNSWHVKSSPEKADHFALNMEQYLNMSCLSILPPGCQWTHRCITTPQNPPGLPGSLDTSAFWFFGWCTFSKDMMQAYH